MTYQILPSGTTIMRDIRNGRLVSKTVEFATLNARGIRAMTTVHFLTGKPKVIIDYSNEWKKNWVI